MSGYKNKPFHLNVWLHKSEWDISSWLILTMVYLLFTKMTNAYSPTGKLFTMNTFQQFMYLTYNNGITAAISVNFMVYWSPMLSWIYIMTTDKFLHHYLLARVIEMEGCTHHSNLITSNFKTNCYNKNIF